MSPQASNNAYTSNTGGQGSSAHQQTSVNPDSINRWLSEPRRNAPFSILDPVQPAQPGNANPGSYQYAQSSTGATHGAPTYGGNPYHPWNQGYNGYRG